MPLRKFEIFYFALLTTVKMRILLHCILMSVEMQIFELHSCAFHCIAFSCAILFTASSCTFIFLNAPLEEIILCCIVLFEMCIFELHSIALYFMRTFIHCALAQNNPSSSSWAFCVFIKCRFCPDLFAHVFLYARQVLVRSDVYLSS